MFVRHTFALACAVALLTTPLSASALAVGDYVFLDASSVDRCAGSPVPFDGRCVGERWIERFLTDGEVEHFGRCDDRDACALYFSELDDHGTSGHVASYTISTWLLSTEPCDMGSACVGGYIAEAKTVLEIDVDAENRRLVGSQTLYGPGVRLELLGGAVHVPLVRVGHTEFTTTSSSARVDVYDHAGDWLSGYGMVASSDDVSFSEEWCKGTVNGLVALAATGVGSGVGALVTSAITFGVTELAAAAAVAGPGGMLVGGAIFISGRGLAVAAGSVAGVTAAAGVKALAHHMDVQSICDDIEPDDDPDDGPTGDPEWDDPTEDEFGDIDFGQGCLICTETAVQEVETAHWDGSTGEMTVTYHEEVVCVDWRIDPEGEDTNDDGWCD